MNFVTSTIKNFSLEIMFNELSDKTVKLLDPKNEIVFLARKIELFDLATGLVKDVKYYISEFKLKDLCFTPEGLICLEFNENYEFRKKKITEEFIKKERELLALKDQEIMVIDDEKKNELLILKDVETIFIDDEKEKSGPNLLEFSNKASVHRNDFVKKTIQQLKEEALQTKMEKPNGPWYDSKRDLRWGYCEFCGEFTKDWWFFEGKNNTCKCYRCKKAGKY